MTGLGVSTICTIVNEVTKAIVENRTIGRGKSGYLTNRFRAWSRKIRINRCWQRIYRRKGSKLVIRRALIHRTGTLNNLVRSWWVRQVGAITVTGMWGETHLSCCRHRALTLTWLLVLKWKHHLHQFQLVLPCFLYIIFHKFLGWIVFCYCFHQFDGFTNWIIPIAFSFRLLYRNKHILTLVNWWCFTFRGVHSWCASDVSAKLSCWWFPCLLWQARVSCFDCHKASETMLQNFVFFFVVFFFNSKSSSLTFRHTLLERWSQLINGKAETLTPCETSLLLFVTDFPIDFSILLKLSVPKFQLCLVVITAHNYINEIIKQLLWPPGLSSCLFSLVLWLTTILLVPLLVILLFVYIQWFLLWIWGAVRFLKAKWNMTKKKLLQFAHCSCNILLTIQQEKN